MSLFNRIHDHCCSLHSTLESALELSDEVEMAAVEIDSSADKLKLLQELVISLTDSLKVADGQLTSIRGMVTDLATAIDRIGAIGFELRSTARPERPKPSAN